MAIDRLPAAALPIPQSAPAGTASARPSSDPAKVVSAAKQFEALLMSQLLKSMREAGGSGWMGTGDDSSGESAMELAEEQFAQALASRGGLGLAKLIADGLTERARQEGQPAAEAPEGKTSGAIPRLDR